MSQQDGASTLPQASLDGRTAPSNSSTKISSPQPITQSEIERITHEGIALNVGSWRFYPVQTPERTLRAWETYADVASDATTWPRFCQEVASGAYFECASGWLLVEGMTHGLSAWLHGGSFAGREHAQDVEPTKELLSRIILEGNLLSLNAHIPDHNKLAARWLERLGFIQTGYIPFEGFWKGEPHGRYIYVLFRKVEE